MKSFSRVFLMMTVALLLAHAVAGAGTETDPSSPSAQAARPGDFIIRYGGETLGCFGTKPGHPFIAVPHMGLFIGDRATHNVVQIKNEHGQANIRRGNWRDRDDFQDGAFFSLLDSAIPVRYQDRIIPMRDLPGSVKDDIRGRVCNIAEVERTVLGSLGGYRFSQFNPSGHSRNCGDWVLGLYDRVFRSMDISVMSHNFPAPRSPEEWLRHPGQLKAGHLQNYAEVLFGTVDPSRLAGWCPRVGQPRPATVPNYWVSPGTASSMTEANTVLAFARGKHRALIVGDGKEAQHMYQATSRLLGPDNVKWIQPGGKAVDWETAARRFKADGVWGTKPVVANSLQNYTGSTLQNQTGDFSEPKHILQPVLPAQKETVSRQRNDSHQPPPAPAGASHLSQPNQLPKALQVQGNSPSASLPLKPASGSGPSGAVATQKASLGSSGSVQATQPSIIAPDPTKRGPSNPWELPGVRCPSGIGFGGMISSPPMMHTPHTFSPSFSAPSPPTMPSLPTTRFR